MEIVKEILVCLFLWWSGYALGYYSDVVKKKIFFIVLKHKIKRGFESDKINPKKEG